MRTTVCRNGKILGEPVAAIFGRPAGTEMDTRQRDETKPTHPNRQAHGQAERDS